MTTPPEVFIGQDDYLFLSGGQHNVLEYFTGAKSPSPESIAHFHNNTAQRQAYCNTHGITYSSCIFPEKICALRHLLPESATIRSIYLRHYESALSAETSRTVTYPLTCLDGIQTHFTRTDTHYATLGAIAVTEHLLTRDLPDQVEHFTAQTEELLTEKSGFQGDLGRKFSPPRSESTRVLDPSRTPRAVSVSNGVETGNDGLLILRKAPKAATDKTLLIFGDSFFRQLLPLLSLVFAKIVFCRTRFFHAELVPAIAPDVIWTGQAERYLARCQPDTDRPHFLSYPLVRGKTLSPDPKFPQLWPKFFSNEKLI